MFTSIQNVCIALNQRVNNFVYIVYKNVYNESVVYKNVNNIIHKFGYLVYFLDSTLFIDMFRLLSMIIIKE